MAECAPATIPLPPGLFLSVKDCPTTTEEITEMKNIPFREVLGSIMWLQIATRPDLSFSVNILSRFTHNPGKSHWHALKHVLAYIKGTKHYGIIYRGSEKLSSTGFVDSDYAGCKDTRRSTEGNIFIVAGEPVSWESKCQETIALSTVEAKFMAFTWATTQALWLSKFFDEPQLQEPQTNKTYRCKTSLRQRTH